MTVVVREPAAFREACEAARRAGKRVGLIPTMGALHRGHYSLVEAARTRADFLALTIFVNPLQFGEGEDLDRYPRTFEADLAGCREHGVDLVFAPGAGVMYPEGFQTEVILSELTRPLEGAFRPGHFAGVTTVVAKLFGLAGRCTATFGRKDYQQWKLLERMARDLDMPVDLIGCPIVREPDGLALSSRNRYLSEEDRLRAVGIVKGLRAAHDAWNGGERRPDVLQAVTEAPVIERFGRIDYVAAVDADTLLPTAEASDRLLMAVAAHLGTTRLIDNSVLGEESRP